VSQLLSLFELVPTATHIECRRHGGTFMVGTEAWCVTANATAVVQSSAKRGTAK
jgi:hypothetical protein